MKPLDAPGRSLSSLRRASDRSRNRAARPWLGAAAALFAVGWGANQFSSLLLAYREHSHIGVVTVDALFGVYAVGLIPALLLGGPLSDRHGRRLVIPVVGGSALATGVLMLGAPFGLPALYTGRFLAGVVSGLAFAPGTAWVKELSTAPFGHTDDPHVGARRAAVALSAGFGAGPLVAGFLAQWVPDPTFTPYLAHLLVVAVVAVPVLRSPETVGRPRPGTVGPPRPETVGRSRPGTVGRSRPGTVGGGAPGGARRQGGALRRWGATDRRFSHSIAPMAPWVFAAASVAFAVLPAQVTRRTNRYEVAFAAGIAGVTLLVGVLVQPWARRLEVRSSGGGVQVGLAAVTTGLVLGAAASATTSPPLVVVAAAVLGGGYGTCLVSGLLEVQRVAPRGELGGLTAVFYALTYLGFSAPLVLSAAASLASASTLLLLGAGLCGLTLLAVRAAGAAKTP